MIDFFVRRSTRLAAREIAGEMVLLSADDSSLYVLNEVGSAVWNAADGRTTIAAIVDAICRRYDVDRQTAINDVTEFVESLAGVGVLTTSSEEMGEDDRI